MLGIFVQKICNVVPATWGDIFVIYEVRDNTVSRIIQFSLQESGEVCTVIFMLSELISMYHRLEKKYQFIFQTTDLLFKIPIQVKLNNN